MCSSCVYFNTEDCPYKDSVMELTYAECNNHYLTKEKKNKKNKKKEFQVSVINTLTNYDY